MMDMMKERSKSIDADFGKCRALRNAMNLEAEYHDAQTPEFPNLRKFYQRQKRQYERVLSENKVASAS